VTAVEPKQFHDVVGYYNRFDVFDLTVNRTRPRPARFIEDEPLSPPAERGVREPTDPSETGAKDSAAFRRCWGQKRNQLYTRRFRRCGAVLRCRFS
jgi:hypothetical protein